MSDVLNQFFFQEKSSLNTIEVRHESCPSMHTNTYLYFYSKVYFEAAYRKASLMCDLEKLDDIKPPKVTEDGCVKIDTRELHMLIDNSNKVLLIGYDEDLQTDKSRIKQMKLSKIDFEVEAEDNIMNCGCCKFIYIPQRLMFNGIKTQHDIEMFLKTVSLYMKKVAVEENICLNKSFMTQKIFDEMVRVFASICMYYLSKYCSDICDEKTIDENISKYAEKFGIYIGPSAFFYSSSFYQDIVYKLRLIYGKITEEEFYNGMIYGGLEAYENV